MLKTPVRLICGFEIAVAPAESSISSRAQNAATVLPGRRLKTTISNITTRGALFAENLTHEVNHIFRADFSDQVGSVELNGPRTDVQHPRTSLLDSPRMIWANVARSRSVSDS